MTGFVLVRGHWLGWGGLEIVRPEHVECWDTELAAGTWSACAAARRLLRDPPRHSWYTDGNELALSC